MRLAKWLEQPRVHRSQTGEIAGRLLDFARCWAQTNRSGSRLYMHFGAWVQLSRVMPQPSRLSACWPACWSPCRPHLSTFCCR